MAHGDAWERKWNGSRRLERVASTLALCLGTWSTHGLSADPHSSTASSGLPRRFKWNSPFLWKTKSGFRECAIKFQTCYSKVVRVQYDDLTRMDTLASWERKSLSLPNIHWHRLENCNDQILEAHSYFFQQHTLIIL